MTLFGAFLIGAGYMIMSDTPPGQFFTNRWAIGAALAPILGILLGLRLWSGQQAGSLWRRLGRSLVAIAEVGVFVVLPVIGVWQAATALGWTSSIMPAIVSRVAAVAASVAIAWTVARGYRAERRSIVLTWGLFGAGFALTGSGLVPLLGAAVAEIVAGSRWRSGRPGSHDLLEATH